MTWKNKLVFECKIVVVPFVTWQYKKGVFTDVKIKQHLKNKYAQQLNSEVKQSIKIILYKCLNNAYIEYKNQ